MKNIAFALLLFALVPVTAFAPSQEAQLTQEQLVHAMRFLNTYEYSYAHDNKRFASLDEFLGWLQETGKLKEAPIGLSAESLKPYELQIITGSDGKHYAISLLRTSDIHDRTT